MKFKRKPDELGWTDNAFRRMKDKAFEWKNLHLRMFYNRAPRKVSAYNNLLFKKHENKNLPF